MLEYSGGDEDDVLAVLCTHELSYTEQVTRSLN